MATYDIAVFRTQKLGSYCEENYGNQRRAQNRAKEHIENAFNNAGRSCNVYTPDDEPNPPSEYYNDSYTVRRPCYQNLDKTYNNLLDWWVDWMGCNASMEVADSNILLSSTDQSDGGQAGLGGNKAVAQTGQHLCEAPTPPANYGDQLFHSAVETVLHEIGHNLTDGDIGQQYPDNDEPWHDLGYFEDRGIIGNAHTPISHIGSDNLCEDPVPSTSAWELNWSDCCVQHWRSPN